MKLYFGNTNTTVTTFLLLGLIGFITYCFCRRAGIHYWGRRTLFLAFYGVTICCYATVRDGLDKTIQHAIDGSCTPGIFNLISVPNVIGCIGAAIILVAGIATIFTKSQNTKQFWFFMMSSGALLKVVTLEISRIIYAIGA